MANYTDADMAPARLAELSREIEELEAGRASLLQRVDRLRARLSEAGTRTAAMRASAVLLYEHLNNMMLAMAELRALEEEIFNVGQGLAASNKESAGLAFETDSFQDTLEEAEDDLERLSAILLEGKPRPTRGH